MKNSSTEFLIAKFSAEFVLLCIGHLLFETLFFHGSQTTRDPDPWVTSGGSFSSCLSKNPSRFILKNRKQKAKWRKAYSRVSHVRNTALIHSGIRIRERKRHEEGSQGEVSLTRTAPGVNCGRNLKSTASNPKQAHPPSMNQQQEALGIRSRSDLILSSRYRDSLFAIVAVKF